MASSPEDTAPPSHPRLSRAQERAMSGDYSGALTLVRETRDSEPRNIYVIAYEKQVERLRELSERHALREETRSDILASLTAIGMRAAATSAASPPAEQQAPHSEGKQAAIERLKDQYFDRAEMYIQRQDYDHALSEVRRVYILQADSITAQQYEERIRELKRRSAPPPAAAAPFPEAETALRGPSPIEAPSVEPRPAEPGFHELPGRRRVILVLPGIGLLLAAAVYGYIALGDGWRTTVEQTSDRSSTIGATEGSERPEAPWTDQRASSSTPEFAPLRGTEVQKAVPPDEGRSASFQSSRSEPAGSSPQDQTATRVVPGEPTPERMSAVNPKFAPPRRAVLPAPPVRDDQQAARVIRLSRPNLPPIARKNQAIERLRVRVQVDARGRPLQARIVESTNSLFNAAAIEAVMQSDFEPARMPSGPVVSWIIIPLVFDTRREPAP